MNNSDLEFTKRRLQEVIDFVKALKDRKSCKNLK